MDLHVAEFFVSDPVTGHYLEVNLSPNGAHWACLFDAPRRQLAEVRTRAQVPRQMQGGGWEARFDVLAWMREHLHFEGNKAERYVHPRLSVTAFSAWQILGVEIRISTVRIIS